MGKTIPAALLLLFISAVCIAQPDKALSFKQEKIDLEMMAKIRNEGLNNSKVMDIAFQLTDMSGPRLQGSPGLVRASAWAKSELSKWGLENAALEAWGNFGKGWELKRTYLAMTAPYYRPMIAFPKTWCSGTGGLKNAEVIIVKAKDSVELETYAGKLKGKIIIFPRNDTLKPSYNADASRYTEEELKKMADYDLRTIGQPRSGNFGNQQRPMVNINKLKEFAKKEGAVAILSTSTRGRDGTLFVQGGGPYQLNMPENFTDIMVAYEDYMVLHRLVNAGVQVSLDADVQAQFYTDDPKGYNVVAEIKGTDKNLKDELVMLGGHLDSWHGSTGATDNAAGCAVMMEAIRILKTLGIKPRRTIRIALWSAEEQGLIGSRNYVRNHFMDTVNKKPNSEHEKVSVYFNVDNGTGKIRGIYTQSNETVKPIFSQWLEPFKDLGATTVTLRNTGGTDHLAFDGIGIPGFQFIQDEIEYDTRTHHTNMDGYDHLQADDLKQAATIVAAFVYNAAMRDEKIPRKQLAKPAAGGQ